MNSHERSILSLLSPMKPAKLLLVIIAVIENTPDTVPLRHNPPRVLFSLGDPLYPSPHFMLLPYSFRVPPVPITFEINVTTIDVLNVYETVLIFKWNCFQRRLLGTVWGIRVVQTQYLHVELTGKMSCFFRCRHNIGKTVMVFVPSGSLAYQQSSLDELRLASADQKSVTLQRINKCTVLVNLF